MRARHRAERGGVTEQGVDIGPGQQPAKRVQHFFAAALIQEPVVNNGRPHVLPIYAGRGRRRPRRRSFFTL